MTQLNQTVTPASHSSTDGLLPRRAFRWIALALSLWLAAGASYLYRQELSMALGLWDDFEINAVNYSRFVDSRDSAQVFQDQLFLVRQGYHSGALFVGPHSLYSRRLLPIDPRTSYQMSFDLLTMMDGTADQGSILYAGVVFFDKDKNIITQPQAHIFGVAKNSRLTRANGRLTLRGVFTPTAQSDNRIPENARYMKITIELNYGDPRAAVMLSNISFKPVDAASGANK